MAKVVIYGASDDLIEVEGDINAELCDTNGKQCVVFSDGTVIQVRYTDLGTWSLSLVNMGTKCITKWTPNEGSDSRLYSDRMEVEGDFEWLVLGELHRMK